MHCIEKTVEYFVRQGNFSINYLLAEIKDFSYKANDKANKPDICSANNRGSFRVKQKAAQVWCLLRTLPFIIGESVELGDPVWEVLLADAAIMDDRIITFTNLYHETFPEQTIKPKEHYTMHYFEQVRRFGPMRNMWNMRFEAKHSFFVDIARRTKCRKNLIKSMAMRHQYMQVLHFESTNYFTDDITSTGGKVIVMNKLATTSADFASTIFAWHAVLP